MRVKCPHCDNKFDIPIRTVLAEAARLAEKRVPAKKILQPYDGTDPDGNALLPEDLEAKRLRDEALRKRLGQKNF